MKSALWPLVIALLTPFVLAGVTVRSSSTFTDANDEDVGDRIAIETLDLINSGDDAIEIDEEHKDVVLVIGNTGAGKSTITKFITEQNLISYRSGSRFLIKDQKGGISLGSNTLVSQTIFPEKIQDRTTNTIYYDLPGFGDTRNASMEIANAYFTKKVADHAKKVKILCIINYTSLRAGETRIDFTEFLKFALKLIADPAKFKLGLALIATKVDYNIDDEEIVPEITDFLSQAKDDITTIIPNEGGNQEKALALIDALLTESSDGSFGRIGYFKQPNIPGPLGQIPGMSAQRARLRKIVEQNIQFVGKEPEDFGISLSSTALSFTAQLLNKLNLQFVNTLNRAGLDLEASYRGQYERLAKPATNQIGQLVSDVKKMKTLVSAVKSASSRGDFIRILEQGSVKMSILKPKVKQLSRLSDHLKFYENLDNETSPKPLASWSEPLKNVQDYLELEKAGQLQALNSQLMERIDQFLISFASDWNTKLARVKNQSLDQQEHLSLMLPMELTIIKMSTIQIMTKSTFNKFIRILQNSTSVFPFVSQKTRNAVPTNLLLRDDVMLWGEPLLTRDAWMRKFQTLHSALSESISLYQLNLQEKVNQAKIKRIQVKIEKITKEAKAEAVQVQNKIQGIEQEIAVTRTNSISKNQDIQNLRAEIERLQEHQRLRKIQLDRQLAEANAAAAAERRRTAEILANIDIANASLNSSRHRQGASSISLHHIIAAMLSGRQ